MDLRSPLAKVKGLGSAHNGTHHWLMQRITAVALIPLVIWFVTLVIQASVSADQLFDFLRSPFHATAMILFLSLILYHGNLGMKVILEDYVHCKCGRTFLVLMLHFVTAVTLVVSILSVINMHLGVAHSGFGRMGHGTMGTVDNPAYKEQSELKRQLYEKLKEEGISK